MGLPGLEHNGKFRVGVRVTSVYLLLLLVRPDAHHDRRAARAAVERGVPLRYGGFPRRGLDVCRPRGGYRGYHREHAEDKDEVPDQDGQHKALHEHHQGPFLPAREGHQVVRLPLVPRAHDQRRPADTERPAGQAQGRDRDARAL